MKRSRRALVTLFALASFVAVSAAQASEPIRIEFVDVSDYPVVRVVFTPPESMRDAGITDELVTLRQDGVRRDVKITALDVEPLELVLVLDTSGSMAGPALEEAKAAAVAFAALMPPESDLAVLAFGDQVVSRAGFEATPDQVTEAINGLEARGETALYDAVIAAVDLVDQTDRQRQFIVLLSDGGDTVSGQSLADVVEALGATEVGFYAIELQGSEYDPAVLPALTRAADGLIVPAADPAGLAGAYTEIALDVSSQFAADFEAIYGGLTSIHITIGGDSFSVGFNVELPVSSTAASAVSPTVDTPATVLTESPESATIELAAPPTRVAPEPRWFQERWALTLGIGVLFVSMLIAFGFALVPQETGQRRSSLATGAFGTPLGAGGGRLRRISESVQDRVESILRRRGRRSVVSDALEAAGIALRPGEFVLLAMVVAVVGVVIGYGLSGPAGALVFGFVALAFPRAIVEVKARKRRQAFADQLPGTLQLIAGSLRAGYGVTQAASSVAVESDSPTSEEFARLVVEVRLGRQLNVAMKAIADRMQNKDLGWISEVIEIQQVVGGDLAGILDTVLETIRDRAQIRRQVMALTAEGRMSAIVLIALPFGLVGLEAILNPGYLAELTGTSVGQLMILGGLVLMAIGVIWIRKIVTIKY